MSLLSAGIVSGIFIILVLLIISGGFKGIIQKLATLTRGAANVFIEDRASTPEGAEMIYSVRIEELQEQYGQSKSLYKTYVGQLKSAIDEWEHKKLELHDIEVECDSMVKMKSPDEDVMLLIDQRADIIQSIEMLNTKIGKLKPLVEQAKQLTETNEKELRKVKEEKKIVINNLNLNKEMEKAYDMVDKLQKQSPAKGLIESIKEAEKESNIRAIGAKEVHESRLDTRLEHAKKSAQEASNTDYLEQLKKKHASTVSTK